MVYKIRYRIPFSETDAMGIVHHSNYARYFERGRIELLRELDLPYARLMEGGCHFPVLEMHTIFRKPMLRAEPAVPRSTTPFITPVST